MKYFIVLLVSVLLGKGPLWSANTAKVPQVDEKQKNTENNQKENGCVPGTLALFPGIIVHGIGHFAAGDSDTATDLLIIEGTSFAVFAGSFYYLARTGASRKIVGPVIPLILTSGSIFMMTWFGDIYGSSWGMGRAPGNNRQQSNRFIRPFMGLVAVDDIQFDYSQFFHCGLDIQYDAVTIRPMVWTALDDDNTRYQVEGGYQLVGNQGILLKKYSHIFSITPLVRTGYHDFVTYGFNKTWIDICVVSRIELGSIWNSMRGAFVRFEWGFNREWVTFSVVDDEPEFANNQLLFESGFGVDLGDLASPLGYFYVYYNHRKDDFTGGLQGGFMGYVGLKASFNIYNNYAITVDYSYGSAAVLNFYGSAEF